MVDWDEFFNSPEPVKDLFKKSITRNDLEEILNQLKSKTHVIYINWNKQNDKILNENKQLKDEIHKQLVKNLTSRADLMLVDFSKCHLESDFLHCLVDEMEKNVVHIGDIHFGSINEKLEQEFRENLNRILTNNIFQYRQFPTDYEFCLLSTHCRNNNNPDVLKKIMSLGWEIQDTFQVDNENSHHMSTIYLNKANRHCVLAFKGLKMDPKEFIKDRKISADAVYGVLGKEITSLSYYAYVHANAANKLSKNIGYSLSFTGYSFGAWLAEQCVYFCHQKFRNSDTKAVTFESPGSYEIVEELHASNNEHQTRSITELTRVLNIKTYLMSPNFINTCNKHFGKVYRIMESSTLQQQLDSIDKFIREKIIGLLPRRIAQKIERWYIKAKNYFRQYKFYLNGIRALFDDDLDTILSSFDENTKHIKNPDRLFRVYNWPLIEANVSSQNLEKVEVPVWDFFSKFLPFNPPQIVQDIIAYPIDGLINTAIREASKKVVPNLVLLINIFIGIKNDSIDLSQCFDCYRYDEYILNCPNQIVQPDRAENLLEKNSFKLVFNGKYDIRKANLLFDEMINFDSGHIDKIFVDAYKNYEAKFKEKRIKARFVSIKKSFKIETTLEGLHERAEITSTKYEIDLIRERFKLLWNIKERLLKIEKEEKRSESVKSHTIKDEFGGERHNGFVKKEGLFEKIDKILKNNHIAFVYGVPGSGKTRLAIEYGHHHKQKDNSFITLFFNSSSLKNNACKLKGLVYGDYSWTDQEDSSFRPEKIIQNIFEKVKAKKILFVVDNANSTSEIESIVKFKSENHKFLITSKIQDLFSNSYDPEGKFCVKIEPLKIDKPIEYLESNGIIKTSKEKEAWRRILNKDRFKRNSFLPLQLEITARIFSNRQISRIDENELIEFFTNHDDFNYKKLREDKPLSFDVLKYLAYIDGQFIDYEILKLLFSDTNEKELKDAVDFLVNSCLLRQNRESPVEVSYEMAETIQTEIKKMCADDLTEKESIMDKLTFLFYDWLPFEQEDFNKWDVRKLQTVSNHVGKLIEEEWKGKLKSEMFFSVLNKIEFVNINMLRDVDKSVKILDKIIKVRERAHDSGFLQLANLCLETGKICHTNEKYNKALAYYYQAAEKLNIHYQKGKHQNMTLSSLTDDIMSDLTALKSSENILKPIFSRLLTKIDKMNVYDLMSLEESRLILEQILDIKQKFLAKNDFGIAVTLVQLATISQQKKESAQALDYYKKATEVIKDDPRFRENLAKVFLLIGQIYSDQFKEDEAYREYQKAVDLLESVNPEHPDLAVLLNKMGLIRKDWQDLEVALKLFQKALEIKEKILPKNHVDFASSWDLIGDLYYKKGDYEKAIKYYKMASENRTLNKVAHDSQEMADNWLSLGSVYRKLKEYNKSLEYYFKSLEIYESLENIAGMAGLLNNIGISYQGLEDYTNALKYYSDSYEARCLVLPNGHQDFIISNNNIGMIYFLLENYAESLDYLNEVVNLKIIHNQDTSDTKNLIQLIERRINLNK